MENKNNVDDKKNKNMADIITGDVIDKDLAEALKDFPEILDSISQNKQRSAQRFSDIKEQYEFLLKIEKDKKSLDPSGLYQMDPATKEVIDGLQQQMIDVVRGYSDEDISNISSPKDIKLSDRVSITEDELLQYIEDPSKAVTVFNYLKENGDIDGANSFSKLIAENINGNFTNKVERMINPTPFPGMDRQTNITTPTPADSPNSIGVGKSPEDNIKDSIASMEFSDPRDKVKKLSSSFKSNINRGV